MTSAGELTLGVIVCCRDEERVIERRLRNLALSKWPKSARQHRVIVVDDASVDSTSKLAAASASAFPPSIRCEVIANRARPGKSSAIASALAQLGTTVDVVVLTDADVVNLPDAFLAFAADFERSQEIGMVSGRQRFVRSLRNDGEVDAHALRNRGTLYDRVTTLVRLLETRRGRLFSVHGQLLAWRARLSLVPKERIAADDLDLMRQARCKKARVELSTRAMFLEVKPRRSLLRHNQAFRRARAFLQFTRTLDPAEAPDMGSRWQWRSYKHLPAAMFAFSVLASLPIIALGCVMLLAQPLALDLFYPFCIASVTLALMAVWSPSLILWRARRQEQQQPMDDRWSTAR